MKRSVLGVLAVVVALLGALVVLWPRGIEAQPHLAESEQFRFVLTPASTRSGSNSFDLRITDPGFEHPRSDANVERIRPRRRRRRGQASRHPHGDVHGNDRREGQPDVEEAGEVSRALLTA